MRDAVSIAEKLKDAFTASGAGIEGITGKLSEITNALGEAETAAGSVSSSTSSITAALNEIKPAASKSTDSFVRSLKSAGTTATTTAKGVNQIKAGLDAILKVVAMPFKAMAAFASRALIQLKAVYQMFKSIFNTMLNIAKVSLQVVLSWLDKFQAAGAELAQELRLTKEEWQKLVGTFGDLSTNEGARVTGAINNMNKSAGDLAGTGRTLASVYGYGPQGVRNMMQEVGKLAEDLGDTFNVLGKEFEKDQAKIVMFQKGLGLTGDEIKGLAQQAIARGKKITDVQREIGNLSTQMAKKFNVSSKEIGKNLAYITLNSGKFGKMMKETAVTSIVYLKKLGMSMKDVEGIMSTWDDFEGAATNASKLAQAFGMNVDALRMMREEDPAKRLDMLRESFAATGRSASSLSRIERDLMASSTGLDSNMVELALSAENMGKSYDEILASAKEAGQVQMTEAEILQDLSKNIQQILRPITYVAGLLENFFRGFQQGWIGMVGENSSLITSIANVIEKIEEIGFKVGGLFGKLEQTVPIFKVFTQYFEKLGTTIDESLNLFEDFFKTIEGGGDVTSAFESLMDGLFEKFDWFFDAGSEINEGFMSALSGIVSFAFDFAAKIGNKLLPIISEKVLGFLDYLIEEVPKAISGIGNSSTISEAASPVEKFISGVFDLAFKSLDKIWILIKNSFSAAMDNPALRGYLITAMVGLFAFIFGPALLSALMSLVGSLVSIFTSLIPLALEAPAVMGAITGGIASLGSAIMAGFEGIVALVSNPVGWTILIVAALAAIGVALTEALLSLFDSLGESGMKEVFGEKTGSFFNGILQFASDMIWGGLQQMFGGMWDIVTGILSGDLKQQEEGWKNLFGGFTEFLVGALGGLFWGAVAVVFGPLTGFIENLFATLGDDTKTGGEQFVEGLWQLVKMLAIYGAEIATYFILTSLGPIGWVISGFLFLFRDQIGAFFKGLAGAFANGVEALFGDNWVTRKIRSWLDTTADETKKATDKLGNEQADALGSAGSKAGSAYGNGFSDGMVDGQKKAKDNLDSMVSITKDYADKTDAEIEQQAFRINRGMENISKLMSQLDSAKISAIEKKLNAPEFARFKEVVKQIQDTFGFVTGFTDSIEKTYAALDKLGTLTNSDLVSKIDANMNNIARAIYRFNTTLGSIDQSIGYLQNHQLGKIDIVRSYVEEIIAINNELEKIGSFDADVKMTNVGNNNLGINNAKIDFERKPINLTLNLNVQMDSQQLTTNISSTAVSLQKQGTPTSLVVNTQD